MVWKKIIIFQACPIALPPIQSIKGLDLSPLKIYFLDRFE